MSEMSEVEASSTTALPDTTAEERAEAAAMRAGGETVSSETSMPSQESSATTQAKGNTIFDTIEGAGIDEDARQKYVLIQLQFNDQTRFLVRGRKFAAYHKDAAQPTIEMLNQNQVPGMRYRVLGGGRIIHSSEDKKIEIFGHSYGFPWDGESMHDTSKEVLAEKYPEYTITTSDEGY